MRAVRRRVRKSATISGVELKTIRYDVSDRIATITLDRPDRLNAWTGRMHTEYRWCLQEAEEDPGVRAIVLTGSGRGFCAGADKAALDGHVTRGGYDDGITEELARPGYGVRPEFDELFAYHFGLTKPLLAAVNGAAAGVGFALACYADMRIAAESAKFTTAHGKLGLPAEFGLSWLLPRIVGLGRANDLLFTSRIVLADEALAMGLANRVVPDGDLRDVTHEFAAELIATVAPASLRETKRQVYTDLHRDIAASVTESDTLLRVMMSEPDFAKGVKALRERRPPDF